MQVSTAYQTKTQNVAKQAEQTAETGKPVWNAGRVYTYLEDFGEAAISYGKRAQSYYAGVTEKDGAMTVDELKAQIGELFSGYTLTDHEPSKVVSGKYYLYIDDSQLKKMASDPAYRAKVYGLMEREYTCGQSMTFQYSDGKIVTEHMTGSIFSLCEKNRKYAGADGIPYLGSCTSDHPWSSSESHVQVRNQSYLYDNIDPARSAARERKTAAAKNAAKREAERRSNKLKEKKRLEKKQMEKAFEKRHAEKEEAAERAEAAREKRQEMNETLSEMMGETTGKQFDFSV